MYVGEHFQWWNEYTFIALSINCSMTVNVGRTEMKNSNSVNVVLYLIDDSSLTVRKIYHTEE